MEKTTAVSKERLSHLSSHSLAQLITYLKEKQHASHNPEASYHSLEDFFSGFGRDRSVLQSGAGAYDTVISSSLTHALKAINSETNFYAIALPLLGNVIFASEKYEQFFLQFQTFNNETISFERENEEIIYQLILRNFYGLSLVHDNTVVVHVVDDNSGIRKYVEFELMTDLIEVLPLDTLPALNLTDLSTFFSQIRSDNLLKEALPLSKFSLQGFVIIRARDVTIRESSANITDILLSMPHMSDSRSFETLQTQVQHLLELSAANIRIASNEKNNSDQIVSGGSGSVSLSMEDFSTIQDGSELSVQLKNIFNTQAFLIVSDFSFASLSQFPFLQSYADHGVKSLMLLPLKHAGELVGVFSIFTYYAGALLRQHLYKLEPLVPLLVVALGRQAEKMDNEIDRVIKEQFTAVQSSVNWKFTEAAHNYLHLKSKGQDGEIENIVFENVFPLYGSIDVRNSSIERSAAIQNDLLEQLHLANDIIRKSRDEIYLFTLQEIGFRIDKFIETATLVLFPGDELAIQNFLDDEIAAVFAHLKKAVPAISDDIDQYFFLLNTNTNKISRQCTAFEKSISMMNNELVKFINQEQAKVQAIYAHYFEYFVTDGVDFNIYIGQSITPDKIFDQFYLKNLRLWQLTTLAKAAQKVRSLHHGMPVALDTTQLILAHGKPLSISYRVAERKFDVDGAYNIHYEIIKKRIDKIKIMGSCERLTQPGKIAIVFAHEKEAQEYTSYINYLQKEGLLDGDIECFDLEELPGVRGLKALRVSINMKSMDEHSPIILSHRLRKVS